MLKRQASCARSKLLSARRAPSIIWLLSHELNSVRFSVVLRWMMKLLHVWVNRQRPVRRHVKTVSKGEKKHGGDCGVRRSVVKHDGKNTQMSEVSYHVLVWCGWGHCAHRAMFLMCNWWHPELICADATGRQMLSEGESTVQKVSRLYARSANYSLCLTQSKGINHHQRGFCAQLLCTQSFPHPFSSACVSTAQSCVQRLSALHSKPKWLKAGLEARRAPPPWQKSAASFCPHPEFPSLRPTCLYTLTLPICRFLVYNHNAHPVTLFGLPMAHDYPRCSESHLEAGWMELPKCYPPLM